MMICKLAVNLGVKKSRRAWFDAVQAGGAQLQLLARVDQTQGATTSTGHDECLCVQWRRKATNMWDPLPRQENHFEN
jgi:hypothetical protein